MLVQDFLLNGGTLSQLEDRFAIVTRRHNEYKNLVLLKYDQIDSPMHEPLVKLCRGLILDEAEDWRVVCRPFDKFFNYGERLASPIDWNTAAVQEKLDGSLCTLYWYGGKWHVSTSGSPDASGKVHASDFTFKDLFWKTFEGQGLKLPAFNRVDFNYMFELMTPYNRVVVQHKESRLALIGIRNRFSGEEFSVGDTKIDYPKVKSFPLTSFEEICKSFDSIDPIGQEGYVVVDSQFNRNKVKHPGYVAIHHLKEGFSRRRILELIRNNEGSEFLAYFPEWRGEYDIIKNMYDQIIIELEADYADINAKFTRPPPDVALTPQREKALLRKEFAQLAIRSRCSSVLFSLYDGKVKSVKEYLKNMNIDGLMDLLKLKNLVFNAE